MVSLRFAISFIMGFGTCTYFQLQIRNFDHFERKDLWRPMPPSENFIDFEEVVADFIKEQSENNDLTITWWDIYGRHRYITNHPEYSEMKIDIDVQDMVYGKARNASKEWRMDSVSVFVNFSNKTTTKFLVGERLQRINYTWKITQGLVVPRTNVHSSAMLTGLGDDIDDLTLDLADDQPHVYFRNDTFRYEIKLNVEPMTSMKFFWNVTTWNVDVPFWIDVQIRGFFAIYYYYPYKSHKIWFYPICRIKHDKFNVTSYGLMYRVHGVFTDTRDVSVTLVHAINERTRRFK